VRDFNKIEMIAVISFLFLQGKAPKDIHAILTETETILKIHNTLVLPTFYMDQKIGI